MLTVSSFFLSSSLRPLTLVDFSSCFCFFVKGGVWIAVETLQTAVYDSVWETQYFWSGRFSSLDGSMLRFAVRSLVVTGAAVAFISAESRCVDLQRLHSQNRQHHLTPIHSEFFCSNDTRQKVLVIGGECHLDGCLALLTSERRSCWSLHGIPARAQRLSGSCSGRLRFCCKL